MGVHFELLHVCDFGCVVHLEKLPSLMIPRKFTKIYKKKKQTGTVPRVFKKKKGETCDFQDVGSARYLQAVSTLQWHLHVLPSVDSRLKAVGLFDWQQI